MSDPHFGFDYESLAHDSFEVNAIRRMTKLWTNFAKYGNPTPKNISTESIQFKPLNATSNQYDFVKLTNDGLVAGINPFSERMEFWNQLYQKFKYLM